MTTRTTTGERGLLRIQNRMYVAGIVFRREAPGRWVPERAAPILGWMMRHETSETLKRFLDGPARRAGWTYEWLPINEKDT